MYNNGDGEDVQATMLMITAFVMMAMTMMFVIMVEMTMFVIMVTMMVVIMVMVKKVRLMVLPLLPLIAVVVFDDVTTPCPSGVPATFLL